MNRALDNGVVRALVPSEAAAHSLSREFPLADLDIDGTLAAVLIYEISYADVVARVKAWMNRSRIGPVLVTDDKTDEKFLPGFAPRRPLEDPTLGHPRPPQGVAFKP